jgi:hypothetical protein
MTGSPPGSTSRVFLRLDCIGVHTLHGGVDIAPTLRSEFFGIAAKFVGRFAPLSRWKLNSRGGRPRIEMELRALIRQMSTENQLWGAPRIHGELLKLGFSVAQSTVATYMVKRRGPPSQGWKTFLRNHAPDIAAMDLFVVPTIGFKLLYGFVIIRIDRRDLVWINVTSNPTAEWIARQITEAFPWDGAPGYMIRDRDRIYGSVVTR